MKKTFAIMLASSLLLLGSCVKNEVPSADQPPVKKGFQLEFGSGFNTGMNAVDDFGISIALIVDVSGSMANRPDSGGEPKYIQAAGALKTVSLYLEKLAKTQKDLKVNVAVIKFSSEVSTVLPLTAMDEGGFAKLNAACVPENFDPKGGTAIGLALERGSEILAQSGTIFNSMIIVTDGANTILPEPAKVIKAIYSNANNKSTADFTVRTSTQLMSFIGFDIDSHIFDEFHELGARITSAVNQSELETSLKSLLEADITKLEGN